MFIGHVFVGRGNAGWLREGLCLIALAGLAIGCGKQASPPQTTPSTATTPAVPSPVLALHWAGKDRVALDTNAAYLMGIWNMPESERLETQTLDKLARALPALLGAPSNNPPADLTPLLRPLLEDLVRQETRLELRTATNFSHELSLAVRLPADRAELWRTNFTAFAEALTGTRVTPSAPPAPGWRAQRTESRLTFQFAQTGGWTLVGLGPESSPVFADFARRLATNSASTAPTNDFWLELDTDLAHFFQTHFIEAAPPLPKLHLTMTGDGQNVRTRGELTFAKPISSTLVPWTIPTNLIHDPLISFTAMRGFQDWLGSSRLWKRLVGDSTPEQIYFWGVRGMPFETYTAAVWPGSSNAFFLASQNLMNQMNPALTNDWGEVTPMPGTNGIVWTCNPFLKAHLRHNVGPLGEIVSGGFSELPEKGHPIPEDLLAQFLPRTNLLYYDWEITEARVFTWIQIPSFLRMVFKKAQLHEGTAGLKWLLAAMPKLGNAGTTIQFLDSHRLAIARNSSAGFTGAELQLLMDWLESPVFPRGLHSFEAPVKVPRPRNTNAAPAGGLPYAAPVQTNADGSR